MQLRQRSHAVDDQVSAPDVRWPSSGWRLGAAAVWALAEIGPSAAAALPTLLSLPVEGLPLRQIAVCVALGKISARRDDVVARLQRDAQSPHPTVRQAARGALRRLR